MDLEDYIDLQIETSLQPWMCLRVIGELDLYPIGSIYAIYGNIYHQYTPNVSIYIPYMDPMDIENISNIAKMILRV